MPLTYPLPPPLSLSGPTCAIDSLRLEIIEKPANDPEWWRARNSRGGIGLVPRNYVEVLEDDALNNSTVSQADAHLMNNSSNRCVRDGKVGYGS